MQLFIGGACAGKRDAVSKRYPTAHWHRLDAGAPLDGWRGSAVSSLPLVVTGWTAWLEAALDNEPNDDRLRERLAAALDKLVAVERKGGPTVVLILPEMGRGIVPMSPLKRRLRDLAGWLAQDATERAEAVWYVRHGLVKRLK
ncbi:bifunctional adenosylcobinamide kinase/adenosylcobinamide-phosphate guanylyltransferase [Halomonas sp. PR-M31]|uniref:bifunctional adenosylcobinamide kinase/adenosylcobinamide-phosphate guanylyltransferase n=1 Tax=Halomonas sp. PR-M31 TaxID=1471202 RepID=UPI0006502570|nr:bifunctional adenosylcobinamide kinase/adenosylcobinamide-phosphate guanylyltransferase [Halomonas sp. PR-M31]